MLQKQHTTMPNNDKEDVQERARTESEAISLSLSLSLSLSDGDVSIRAAVHTRLDDGEKLFGEPFRVILSGFRSGSKLMRRSFSLTRSHFSANELMSIKKVNKYASQAKCRDCGAEN